MERDSAAALSELEQAYRDPRAGIVRASEAGKRVIAYCGQGIPEELILAAGCAPVALVPDANLPTPLADEQFDREGNPWTKSMFEQLVGPTADSFELAIIGPPFSEVSNIIEDVRRYDESLANVVPLYYFELVLRQIPRNRRFAEERMTALVRRLNALVETELDDAALAEAIALTNRRREAMKKLIDARRGEAVISGAAAYRALGARKFMDADGYTASVDAIAASLAPVADLQGRPRIVLAPSSALAHDQAHEALEATGALIVAEDDSGGARTDVQLIDTEGDPLAAIAAHYHETTLGHHMFPAERRLEWIKTEAIKPDVDGVVFYAEDSHFGWDFPELKAHLEAHGKEAVLFDADARRPKGRAELEEMARPFVERLAAKREERSR